MSITHAMYIPHKALRIITNSRPHSVKACYSSWPLKIGPDNCYLSITTRTIQQNSWYFAGGVFKSMLLTENVCILIYVSIISVSGLAPDRRQTISWTKNGLVHWRTNAPLSFNKNNIHSMLDFSWSWVLIAWGSLTNLYELNQDTIHDMD